MSRYVCVHGHFYQPPRENPWLEAVELQDSAHPFHDWNERITAECYAPNGACRILDGEGWIAEVVNNYARMSFNMGPTLLSWLHERAPGAYASVIAADGESRARFSGHGSALAQVYNHMILPLASRRDKTTQVIWGVRDFERRFGRAPEGMWLAETAADVETLEVLAENGIKFTILSPHQAKRVRKVGEGDWRDVGGGRVDPSMAYRVGLPGGRSIAVFFYDGPISQAIAFEGLLASGDKLVDRLMGAFSDARQGPQLAHIATDGESYGHHHRHGEMALGYALRKLEAGDRAKLTVYGEFLERHPPDHEAEIIERSSWSCAHGVERWRKHCGCSSGGRPGWNQHWRGPLREALDALRDRLAACFEACGPMLLPDPWRARDAYIAVILDRSSESADAFLRENGRPDLSVEQRIRAWKLLEMQRQAMLMYTSCGWFFDEVSGIETVQILRYASRAIQLARDVCGEDFEPAFVEKLAAARSNIPELKDGRRIYEKLVKPASIDLERVGAHYALSSLFEEYRERDRIYCYRAEREEHRVRTAGAARLALGRVRIVSEITGESARLAFGALHLGDHNLSGGVRPASEGDEFDARAKELEDTFERMDVPELVRAVDRSFGSGAYTLRHLFRDEQRKIAGEILREKRERAEAALRALYDEFAPLMRFLAEVEIPPPPSLAAGTEFVLGASIARLSENGEEPDPTKIRALLDEARRSGVTPDEGEVAHGLRRVAGRLATRLTEAPEDLDILAKLDALADIRIDLDLEIDFWSVENAFFDVIRGRHSGVKARADAGDEAARAWVERVRSLAEKLRIRQP